MALLSRNVFPVASQHLSLKITASQVVVDVVDGALVVAFCQGANGELPYLLLQRAGAVDAQSVALGHSTYFVELNGQSQSCYGGIDQVTFARSRLSLTFSDTAARALKVNACEVAFSVDDAHFERLRAAVHDLFSGMPTALRRD